MENARPAGNLNDDGQSFRLRVGVIAMGISLAIAVLMLRLGAPVPARAALVVPFMFSANWLLQALHRT